MIRCVRLWTGADGRSHFEEGLIELEPGPRGDALSAKVPVKWASFQETDVDPRLGWHRDAVRQLVVTLSGALEFSTDDGSFSLRPGDILFTEDISGSGHDWAMLDGRPWRRLYAVLDPETIVPFRPAD